MIEFDEAEFKSSAVSDETLYLVLLFCGPEVRDRLLYGGDNDVGRGGHDIRSDLLHSS